MKQTQAECSGRKRGKIKSGRDLHSVGKKIKRIRKKHDGDFVDAIGSGIPAAKVVFWLAALLLFYVYAGYPLLLAIIGLFVRSRRLEPGYCPRISVSIAAYNEEEAIARKIEQTLALEYPADKLEVLVLSDCSTDRTDEIVSSFPDKRVRLVRMKERRGTCAEPGNQRGHRRGHRIFRCYRRLSNKSSALHGL